MLVWKNTSTLDGYDDGLVFTEDKIQAEIALLGSKPLVLNEFPNLKGIFRAGIGKDNVPEKEAIENGILVKYPSSETIDIIYNETATYTCSLIFRMLYNYVGTIKPWHKYDRDELKSKRLLVIGNGNIGKRVIQYMQPFMNVTSFDILENDESELDVDRYYETHIPAGFSGEPSEDLIVKFNKITLLKYPISKTKDHQN